jgi:cytidylate kinase
MGYEVDLEELSLQIHHRDLLDQNRPIAPLRQAPDAVVIDTTDMPVARVIEQILRIIDEKGRGH